MFKKFNFLYLLMYMFSPFMIFFMNSFYSMWILMELNLMLFITFLVLMNNFLLDKLIKYYLLNAFGSMMFLFFVNMNLLKENMSYIVILNMSMLLKLGMFPFHNWFIDLMMELEWLMCFFLCTLQKLIPMMVLMYFYNNFLLILISIMGSFYSLMMIFNQIYLKKLMGYSSIVHLSWLLISMLMSMKLFLIYFFAYILILYTLMYYLSLLNFETLSDMYMYMYKWM